MLVQFASNLHKESIAADRWVITLYS